MDLPRNEMSSETSGRVNYHSRPSCGGAFAMQDQTGTPCFLVRKTTKHMRDAQGTALEGTLSVSPHTSLLSCSTARIAVATSSSFATTSSTPWLTR